MDVRFRKRAPERGFGYDPANRKGWMATLVFILAAIVVGAGPALLLHSVIAAMIGMALVLPVTLAFLAVVRRHCAPDGDLRQEF